MPHAPVIDQERVAVHVGGGEVERGHPPAGGAVGLDVPEAFAQMAGMGAVVVVAPVTGSPAAAVVPDDVARFHLPGGRVAPLDDRGYQLIFGDRAAEQVLRALLNLDRGQFVPCLARERLNLVVVRGALAWSLVMSLVVVIGGPLSLRVLLT